VFEHPSVIGGDGDDTVVAGDPSLRDAGMPTADPAFIELPGGEAE
jgi:hypothetical protein